MMEWGLRGPALPRRRAFGMRVGAIALFLAVVGARCGVVEALGLVNPIFLPGPWLVIGKVVELASNGQLWAHVAPRFSASPWASAPAPCSRSPSVCPPDTSVPSGVPSSRSSSCCARSATRNAAALHRVDRHRRGVQGRLHHVRDVLPDVPHHVHAVRRIDPLLVRAAQSLGPGRASLFFRVLLPAALPEILTGMRLGWRCRSSSS